MAENTKSNSHISQNIKCPWGYPTDQPNDPKIKHGQPHQPLGVWTWDFDHSISPASFVRIGMSHGHHTCWFESVKIDYVWKKCDHTRENWTWVHRPFQKQWCNSHVEIPSNARAMTRIVKARGAREPKLSLVRHITALQPHTTPEIWGCRNVWIEVLNKMTLSNVQ